jgi:polyisoprenoid-binding protein YceI
MRLRSWFVAVALALFLTASNLAAEELTLSPQNTKIEWIGTKPGGKHTGGFGQFSGTIDVANSKLTVEIGTDSLHSDNNQLTGHLKGPDFFNVQKHTKASFNATKIEAKKSGAWTHQITGDLTLLGKKKTISFPAKVSTEGGLTLESKFTIDRRHYGMNFGQGRVDNPVTIIVSVNAK